MEGSGLSAVEEEKVEELRSACKELQEEVEGVGEEDVDEEEEDEEDDEEKSSATSCREPDRDWREQRREREQRVKTLPTQRDTLRCIIIHHLNNFFLSCILSSL